MGSLRIAPAVLIALAAVACGSSDGAPEPLPSDGTNGTGGTLGPDGLPVGPDGKPLPPRLDGRYELSSTFDLTAVGVFPDVANVTLKALSNFKEHPSQTLVDVLDAARVPVVPQVINAIPALIRDQVLGFFDDYLFKSLYAAVPFAKSLTSMLDDLATITTRFELVTNLELPEGDAVGDSRGAHTFAGVAYRWQDKRTFIGAPTVLMAINPQSVPANAVALARRSPTLESARLKLGDHRFTVPIGSFAVLAADALAKDTFGVPDLRAAVGKIVNCEALADDVSKRCIDPFGPGRVCVDHKSEIKGLCETGLDTLVATLQAQLKLLDLPLLRLKEGGAQMWDAPTDKGVLDATVDRLDHGFWTAGVNVGKSEKTILATFVGRRIGDVGSPTR